MSDTSRVERDFEELLPAGPVPELSVIKEELERQLRETLVRDYDPVEPSESPDGADARP
jgi:hypothetical protein